jgi:Tol biopolymer transport system component
MKMMRACLLAVAVAMAAAAPAGAVGITERVSVATGGMQANDASSGVAISAGDRYVAFYSPASNLVPGDSNGLADVFVRDRRTGATERVSVATGGGQADGASFRPAISANGRWVAYLSAASNLVAGDTNQAIDVFVRDRVAGVTQRVSLADAGFGQGAGQADADSGDPAISADGRYVAFESFASNLVPDDSNGVRDLFVHDRATGSTERVSITVGGEQANGESLLAAISADGRYVGFTSNASNLVAEDGNSNYDVFVHDRHGGGTERVSVGSGGEEANAFSARTAISADGRYVAFDSDASNLATGDSNLTDVFVHDRQTGATERVSVATGGTQAAGDSIVSAISADGRHVVFKSFAPNLVSGDTNGVQDVFVHDRQSGTTERVSVATNGGQANSDSVLGAISADGSHVAFMSFASNLVAGDTNGGADIFVRDRAGTVCSDGVDNDGDGRVDFPADPGCRSATDNNEANPRCSDGLDNDGDGRTDFPADPGCDKPSDNNETNPRCNDGLDNDADGLTDHPADLGCASPADNREDQ